MRLRVGITTLILFINIIFQSTLLHHIMIRGVLPNTMVILVVSYALLRGSEEGAIVGMATGLTYDMLYGQSVGFYAFLLFAIGYACGRSHQNFYRENYLLPLFLCTVATFLFETSIYIMGYFFNGNLNFIYFLSAVILPKTVYTAVISIVFYRILFGINDWLETKEKRRYRYY